MPYSGIIRGTEGASELTLTIENGLDAALACEAGLAHWYSETLGRAEAGTRLEVTLWHDPQTGVLNLLNATRDRMPVEAIWCGRASAFSATRTRLTLPMRAGALDADRLRFRCVAGDDAPRLSCTQE